MPCTSNSDKRGEGDGQFDLTMKTIENSSPTPRLPCMKTEYICLIIEHARHLFLTSCSLRFCQLLPGRTQPLLFSPPCFMSYIKIFRMKTMSFNTAGSVYRFQKAGPKLSILFDSYNEIFFVLLKNK